MNALTKIIGLLVLGAAAYSLSQVYGKRKAPERKPSVRILEYSIPEVRKRFFILNLAVCIDNPTKRDIELSVPNIILQYNGENVAEDNYTGKTIEIKAGEKKILREFDFQIFFSQLRRSGFSPLPDESPKRNFHFVVGALSHAHGNVLIDCKKIEVQL